MIYRLIACLFLLTHAVCSAQVSELNEIIQANKPLKLGKIKQSYKLFEKGKQTETLNSEIIVGLNITYLKALPVEILTFDSIQLVLDQSNSLAFLVPKTGEIGAIDTLLNEVYYDSIGTRANADSGYYIDLKFIEEYPFQSMRLFYSSTYVIRGYQIQFLELENDKWIAKSIECEMEFFRDQDFSNQIPVALQWQAGEAVLKGAYKNFQLLNMLQN